MRETCEVELNYVLHNFIAIIMMVYTEDRLDEITYVGVKIWLPSMGDSGFLSRAPMRPKVCARP